MEPVNAESSNPTANVSVGELIEKAAAPIPEVWSLKTFIAANPLKDLLHLPIERAIEKSIEIDHYASATLPHFEQVNRQLIKWLIPYIDQGQVAVPMPGKEKGFYGVWRDLVMYDRTFDKRKKRIRDSLDRLPPNPDQAILKALNVLEIPFKQWENYLTLSLAALPGWAGWIKGQMKRPRPKITLDELLAVRLSLQLLYPKRQQPPTMGPPSFNIDSIKGLEEAFLLSLLRKLDLSSPRPPIKRKAQFLFCIDVRSELLRRTLEESEGLETFGCAGFFGLPIHYFPRDAAKGYAGCPVILNPQADVYETLMEGQEIRARREKGVIGWKKRLKAMHHSLKYHFGTSFILAEASGFLSGLTMCFRTFFSKYKIKTSRPRTAIRIGSVDDHPVLIDAIASLLKTIGLTDRFSPFVVVCGHGSETTNNPYASSLQCGACGGNEGKGNAATFATLLNDKSVRQRLKEKGITVPATTRFIAAQHQTTTDEMVFFHEPVASEKWDRIKKEVKKATLKCGNRRHRGQGNKRSRDWSEVRPEWGLARNGALIIGPRSLTAAADLEGRCFLQSYDDEKDHDGSRLEEILLGPLVVAHWINAQYLFSSLFPNRYGSGNKITHNLVGKIGVMQGNGSDLMDGLPMQSVFINDTDLYHEPLRLTVVIRAPLKRVKTVLNKQPSIRQLFTNQWAFVTVIDPRESSIFHLSSDHRWEKVDMPTET
ncbi:MAG: putative inorganic carbon transporter subunit DabA [Chlamydiota bacterium]